VSPRRIGAAHGVRHGIARGVCTQNAAHAFKAPDDERERIDGSCPRHYIPSERRTARLRDLIVAFGPLAVCLARTAHGSGVFTRALLRGLLVVAAQLHFTIDAFALQLLLESAEGLIDIVVANDDLHGRKAFDAQRRNGELPSLYGAVARKPTPEMHLKAQIGASGHDPTPSIR